MVGHVDPDRVVRQIASNVSNPGSLNSEYSHKDSAATTAIDCEDPNLYAELIEEDSKDPVSLELQPLIAILEMKHRVPDTLSKTLLP